MTVVADDYDIARFLIELGLGLIYLIAFAVAFIQFPTPPGAGVHGMSGYHAAQSALKRLRG